VVSDDQNIADFNSNIELSQEVKISAKDEIVQLEPMTIYKYVDFNDGTSSIVGNVIQVNFLNGTAIIDDTIPAQNEDVFLKYADSDEILERARTSFDGTYMFNNIIQGEYEIFTYSEQLSSNISEVKKASVSIVADNTTAEPEEFIILNY